MSPSVIAGPGPLVRSGRLDVELKRSMSILVLAVRFLMIVDVTGSGKWKLRHFLPRTFFFIERSIYELLSTFS